jgi:hypothetical protein
MLIPTSLQHSALSIQHCVVVAIALTNTMAVQTTLRSVGGLPAHVAGRFTEQMVCRQTADGTFFIFDRRSHTVFALARGADEPREIVKIGAEPGRILRPYAFDVAPDGSFVVADAPEGRGRVQFFMPSGSRLGGFALPGRSASLVAFDGLVIGGLGSLVFTDVRSSSACRRADRLSPSSASTACPHVASATSAPPDTSRIAICTSRSTAGLW